ncbi:hypothetical protein GWN42_13565 [candidate division KSB1 bacterium]|nr:hypothetical protein [candidate division KSB1 bacterium]
MSDDRENLDVGLSKVFESLFAKKHFCMPAQVTQFDPALQTVAVQPALKILFQGETVPRLLPIIEDVPIVYPGGGNFFVTFDILPGHTVLLIFAERSIENWANLGGIADPQSTRKCDLSDAIAIPGVLPTPTALKPPVDSASLTIRNLANTVFVRVKDSDIEVGAGAGSIKLSTATGQANINNNFTVDV